MLDAVEVEVKKEILKMRPSGCVLFFLTAVLLSLVLLLLLSAL